MQQIGAARTGHIAGLGGCETGHMRCLATPSILMATLQVGNAPRLPGRTEIQERE